jgi:uncharacterized protein
MVRGMNATPVRSQPHRCPAPPETALSDRDRVSKVGWQRSVDLTGPAGRLEAILNQGAPNAAYAVLISHPHPLGGGSMHNKVVYHAMKALNSPAWGLELPVLRFNFRGVGLSEGQHDGQAESEDVAAALAWLVNEYNLPIVAAGFSFGAAMTIKACCESGAAPAGVRVLAALGLPTEAPGRNYSYPGLGACALPKLFLSGGRDQFAPASQLTEVIASAADPKRLVLLPGADHFFTGQLEPMQQTLAAWMKEQMP